MKAKRVLLLLVLSASVFVQCFSQSIIGRQKVDQYPVTSWNTLTYGLTWLPSDYNSTTKKYPLILFLHGRGETGDGISGLYTLVTQGLPLIIANGFDPQAVNPADGQNYQFIVVSPQAPSASQWSYGIDAIRNILPDVISRYRIDTSRIYVTGLSAGGSGTLASVTNGPLFAKKISAIVPICAAGTNSQSEMDQLPLIGGTYGVKVWYPCGANDSWITFATSTVNTINNASPAPQIPVVLTSLPGVGHEPAAWNTVYDPSWRSNEHNMNIYEWMLQYNRALATTTAYAGADQTITLPLSQVTLTGTGTPGSGNSITGYNWTQISGPVPGTIATPGAATTQVTNLIAGTYVYRFTVTDNTNATASDSVTVVVNAMSNLLPLVNAGADTLITLPADSASLHGKASDNDGTIVAYSWRKVSGPLQSAIVDTAAANTMVKNLVQGIYLFELAVRDNNGAIARDTVAVVVNAATNLAPVANAGIDKTITLPLDSVMLQGSGTDTDGTIVAYSWRKVSGPLQSAIVDTAAANTIVKNLVQGIYLFELVVRDNIGAIARDTVAVVVNAATNLAPVAHAGTDRIITLPLDSVILQGSGTDTDGTIVGYAWKKISGPASGILVDSSLAQARAVSLVAGTYLFQLTVTDNAGAKAKDSVQITVLQAPAPLNTCNGVKRYMIPTVDGGKYLNSNPSDFWYEPVNPGDTLVLKSQYSWSYFSMEGYNGTAACPIVVMNEGGQVWLTSGISVKNCQHVKITGTGHPGTYYGFKVFNPAVDQNSVAVCITGKTRVVEVEGVDVYKKTYGVWAKQDPLCDTSYNYPNFIMDSIEIHHSRFKNIGQDCIYAGNTDPLGTRTYWCDGVAKNFIPMRLSNINIHHLIIDSCNRTGIQLGGANSGYNQIHDNLITRCGYEYNQWQGTGIAIGGMTRNCHVYNNTIKNTFLYGIMSFGVGTNYIENNTIDSTGYLNGQPNLGSRPCNILASPKETIPFDSTTVIIRNNKLGLNSTVEDYNVQVVTWGPATWTVHNVVCTNTKLNGTTPAHVYIDPNVTCDTNCTNMISRIPPVARAGNDTTLLPPADSVRLNGSATDADGNIISYLWTKVSGPAQFTIGNASQPQTTFSNLVPGFYVFRLTAMDNDSLRGTDDVEVRIKASNLAPLANAGPNRWITLPLNQINMAAGGYDVDGFITSYQWNLLSAPSLPAIANTGDPLTQVINLQEGVYTFELVVTDNMGATGKDTMVVNVYPEPPASNLPPVANAGPDMDIILPTNAIVLNGSGSDADGNIVSYKWTKISGPAGYIINNPSQAQTSVSDLSEGSYVFELTVTDNVGASATDRITVVVHAAPNLAPIVNAGADRIIILPTNTVLLSGVATDLDGTIVAYQWNQVSGPGGISMTAPAQAQTSVNGLIQGVYQFALTVTDNSGAVKSDTVMITVNTNQNMSPLANAGPDQSITLPVNTVVLSGSGSDADGAVISYQWTKISGPSFYLIVDPASEQTSVTNLQQGIYLFALTATDNMGATGKDTVMISVFSAPPAGGNLPPVANAGNNQVITLPVNSVTLAGSGSDADGSIIYWQWAGISGPSSFTIVNSMQPQTAINDLVPGIYQFELTVTDNNGTTAKDTVQVTVNAAVNLPPVANAGPDQVITLPLTSVNLNGSASDADGTVVSYQWRRVGGPVFYSMSNSAAQQTLVSSMMQGSYLFELTVTDNQGAIGKDTVSIMVNPAANNLPPVANAGNSQSLFIPANSTTLAGSGQDPDGTVVSYQWTKISGPASGSIVSPGTTQTLITDLSEGDYSFELKVTDNLGAVGRDTVSIIVSKDLRQTSSALIYPNPGTTTMNVKIDAVTNRNQTKIRIYDARGLMVYEEEFLRTQQAVVKQIDVTRFSKGAYLVVVDADINQSITLKYLKF